MQVNNVSKKEKKRKRKKEICVNKVSKCECCRVLFSNIIEGFKFRCCYVLTKLVTLIRIDLDE